MLPALFEVKQKRFDTIFSTLKKGQFNSIKGVLESKSFLIRFALDFGKMVSNGGDNADEKPTDDATHIAGDKG